MRNDPIKRSTFLRYGAASLALPLAGAMSSCSTSGAGQESTDGTTLRIGIGTQNTTTNTVTGGIVLRELGLLDKHLPRDGKYQGINYDLTWSDSPSAPALTNQMLANKLDIAMMADYPLLINGARFQEGYEDRSIFIATLSYNAQGAGNGIVVPTDSTYENLIDLEGRTLSAPVGTAAHGMTIKALSDQNLSTDFVHLINQPPDASGAGLQTEKVDAFAGFVPFPELFSFQGFARKIFDGSETNVPTFHGVVARESFAQEHPDVVVGYLRAVMEANEWVTNNPQQAAERIAEWTGIDREVVYLILGRNGIMSLDPTIKSELVDALRVGVDLLTEEMDIISGMNLDEWVRDEYVRAAYDAEDRDYEVQRNKIEPHVSVRGRDETLGADITDQKLAGEIWPEGREILSFATPGSVLREVRQMNQRQERIQASYVSDYESGTKVFADKAFYVDVPESSQPGEPKLAAFATQNAAHNFADRRNIEVLTYDNAFQRL